MLFFANEMGRFYGMIRLSPNFRKAGAKSNIMLDYQLFSLQSADIYRALNITRACSEFPIAFDRKFSRNVDTRHAALYSAAVLSAIDKYTLPPERTGTPVYFRDAIPTATNNAAIFSY